MNRDELEFKLFNLSQDWPAASVCDVVVAQIRGHETRQIDRRVRNLRSRIVAAALAAAAMAAALLFAADLWRSPTLYAQVQEAIRRAETAHVLIEVLAEADPQRGEIWFDRKKGFRCENPQEVTVDDGQSSWTWNRPAPDGGDVSVLVRDSGDGAVMIAELLDLDGAPADWRRERLAELDEPSTGGADRAYQLIPLGADPATRIVFWLDGEDRPRRLSWQQRHGKSWQEGRRATINYDAAIAPERLVADFPPKARVTDVRQGLAGRFPLERALVKQEAEGIMFAVHEAESLENQMYYFVTSARGTDEFLKQHPPIRRRVNLNLTALDVARHVVASGTPGEFHTMGLLNAEENGVHYCWWIAAPRKYFRFEGGERRFEPSPYPVEVGGGVVEIPLGADLADPKLRDARGVSKSVGVSVQVAAFVAVPRSTLGSVAARLGDDARIVAAILGSASDMPLVGASLQDNAVRFVSLEKLTDEEYAAELERLYEQLLANDELQDAPAN